MSIANNARASQIVKNMKKGKYHSNNKWRDYGSVEEDKPSWDFRFTPKLQTKKSQVNG